jgi:hypothetical protein
VRHYRTRYTIIAFYWILFVCGQRLRITAIICKWGMPGEVFLEGQKRFKEEKY